MTNPFPPTGEPCFPPGPLGITRTPRFDDDLNAGPLRMSAVDNGPLTIIATFPFLNAVWALP